GVALQFKYTSNSVILAAQTTTTVATSAVSPTNADPIPFTVNFSSAVTGFDASDITVTNGTVVGFGGSGASYSFGVTPGGDGLVSVSVAANKATDGNSLGNLASNSVSATSDKTAPTPTVAAGLTSPTNISPIPFTVNFNEAVTGFDQSDVTVSNG